jgi:hypothetical protein
MTPPPARGRVVSCRGRVARRAAQRRRAAAPRQAAARAASVQTAGRAAAQRRPAIVPPLLPTGYDSHAKARARTSSRWSRRARRAVDWAGAGTLRTERRRCSCGCVNARRGDQSRRTRAGGVTSREEVEDDHCRPDAPGELTGQAGEVAEGRRFRTERRRCSCGCVNACQPGAPPAS